MSVISAIWPFRRLGTQVRMFFFKFVTRLVASKSIDLINEKIDSTRSTWWLVDFSIDSTWPIFDRLDRLDRSTTGSIQICVSDWHEIWQAAAASSRLREWSRMVVKKFQDGGRLPFWKSLYRHNYLSETSSDFDEILYTAADFELDERNVNKNEKKVALDRLRVRQNVFLVLFKFLKDWITWYMSTYVQVNQQREPANNVHVFSCLL